MFSIVLLHLDPDKRKITQDSTCMFAPFVFNLNLNLLEFFNGDVARGSNTEDGKPCAAD